MDNYKLLHILGEGTFGRVHKAQNLKTKEYVAIKETKGHPSYEGIPFHVLREFALLKETGHPNVIKLLDVIIEATANAAKPKVYLVFEFVDYDLQRFLSRKFLMKGIPLPYSRGLDKEEASSSQDKKPRLNLLPYATAKDLAFQMLLGLAHCHATDIIHRDLKPANLLYDTSKNSLKIADFGLAKKLNIPVDLGSNKVATLPYRAPELLLGSLKYSTPVDIWSAGCIFAELIYGTRLFTAKTEFETLLQIMTKRGTPTVDTWPHGVTLRDWQPLFPKFEEEPFTTDLFWDKNVPSE